MCLSELGQFNEALPVLRKAFKQTVDGPLRRLGGLQLQRAYTGLEQDDKAVEVALELSRLYPDDPEVLYHGGRLFANFAYLQTLKHADASSSRTEAVKEFEEELRVDATSANAAYELGEMHRQSGEMDKAADLFARALQHYPDFDEARIALGRALMSLGQPGQALPHLQKAVSLNPGSEVAYYQLAQCHRALGNEAEQGKALAEFQRLHGQRSKNPDLTALVPAEVTRQELDAKPMQQQ
jgi:tetratricopeptide (TPR) repeat protein